MNYTIKTQRKSDSLMVSDFEDNVWMTLHLDGANARVILSPDQAQQLINALHGVIASRQKAA